jgi:hypothetical protein
VQKTQKPAFLNFKVDHLTLLLASPLYNVSYVLFRNVFGVTPEDLLYEKRKEWTQGAGESSMTYAVRLGEGVDDVRLNNTIVAVVHPSEPAAQSSHVREMLHSHQAAAHWQHVALRTPDLLSFHQHAMMRGVRFITPILKDDDEDLIQAFSGEWFFPGMPPSGMFFEFLQRDPSPESLQKIKEQNRQSWFRDETFLGLYAEKEREYQSGKVTPFVDFTLFEKILAEVGTKKIWQITEADLKLTEEIMLEYSRKFPAPPLA